MLKDYVIAAKLPHTNDHVEVVMRDDCFPGKYEPITDADTRQEAEVLAEKINSMGGAMVYLDSLN